jgi:hypothetical protein
MFIEGLLAWVFAKLHAKAEPYSFAIAAGFIAGEPFVAVPIAALMAAQAAAGPLKTRVAAGGRLDDTPWLWP